MARNNKKARMPILRNGKIIFLPLYQLAGEINFSKIMEVTRDRSIIPVLNFKDQLYYVIEKCLVYNNEIIFYIEGANIIVNNSNDTLIKELWKEILIYTNEFSYDVKVENKINIGFSPDTHNTNISSEHLDKYLKAAIALI